MPAFTRVIDRLREHSVTKERRGLRMAPKLLMVLSENWTLTTSRDMRALVRIAVGAEQAGIDGVMLSEHIVLGPSAGASGVMENPREYAHPGNQPPDMPWPSSLVLLSAIAAVTERLRLVAGAIIAPLRHPLLLAKELGTLDLLSEGRLVVLPTVSWHVDEYDALGVPFHERGAILDEQLEVLARCWAGGPVSFDGRHFSFDDVWVEPRPYRPDGPVLWFGGERLHPSAAAPHRPVGEGVQSSRHAQQHGHGGLARRPTSSREATVGSRDGRGDPRSLHRYHRPGRYRRGTRGSAGSAGCRIRHHLLQAVHVHRRGSPDGRLLPGSRAQGRGDHLVASTG